MNNLKQQVFPEPHIDLFKKYYTPCFVRDIVLGMFLIVQYRLILKISEPYLISVNTWGSLLFTIENGLEFVYIYRRFRALVALFHR
jgi:hypothetical protein